MIIKRQFFWMLIAYYINRIIAEKSHFSASVVSMIKLHLIREQLVSRTTDYVEKLQDKINLIQESLTQMQKDYSKSQIDPEAFLANPLNAYSLIRHMHNDWTNWQLYMEEIVGQDEILEVGKLIETIPTRVEVTKSLEALERIQQVYNLRIEDFSNGVVQGQYYGHKFTEIESFTVGLHYFHKHDYSQAAEWFKLTTKQFNNNFSDVFEYLGMSRARTYLMYARALLNQDRQVEALKVVKDGLFIEPQNAKLLRLQADIQIRLRTAFTKPIKPFKKKLSFIKELCRGGFHQPSRLTCRHSKINSPFLHLAPFKIEELRHDPLVVRFHDVIYSGEIYLLTNIGRSLMNVTSPEVPFTYSQVFLKNNHSSTTYRVNRRVNDMLGAHLSNSDGFKLINYGLGGMITQNFIESSSHAGTVLFYLSDVQHGGAMVLPNLKTKIHPVKGSALLWMNSRNKETFDSIFASMVCPVIVGSKWVMIKDIYSDGEFIEELN